MAIKLSKDEQEFRNPLITQIDAKQVDLDRTLVNLFMVIKHAGKRPVATKARKEVTLTMLYERLIQDVASQRGLAAYPQVIENWLASDLVDMVFQGVAGKEAVAALRPLHLDAYKLRNPKHTRDYNTADQLYSLLYYGDPEVMDRLRNVFSGVSSDEERVPSRSLDLDTLVILRLISGNDMRDFGGSDRPELAVQPLSLAAARLLADDVSRLLAYEAVIPRHVMLEYLKTLLGIHLGLYVLRLWYLLPGWVEAKQAGGLCPHCHGPHADDPMAPCRYRPLLLVDMGDDFHSPMAALSQANTASHYARINDFIKAVFTVNQLMSYISKDYTRKGQPITVAEALARYQNPDDDFRPEFRLRVKKLFDDLDRQREEAEQQTVSARKRLGEQAQWAELDAIRQMGLEPFEAFIEAVTYIRTPFHREYWVKLIDSLLQKNSDSGVLRQGQARANGRRFHIGSQLLEVLVQLAILEPVGPAGAGGFRSRPMLIDTFVQWLLDRYGLVINGLDVPAWAARAEMPVPEWAQRTGMHELEAYRDNLRALKDRLREIGFYTDLSDAYNAQTIRPRYSLETSR